MQRGIVYERAPRLLAALAVTQIAIVAALVYLVWPHSVHEIEPYATARRPLVTVAGTTEQMPTGDYLAANTVMDTSGCSSGQSIQWNGSAWVCATIGTGLTGLTTNTIPKAVSSSNLGDSTISDNGTTVTIAENVSINSNGDAMLFSTKKAAGTDGFNIFIGGGGQSVTGTSAQGSSNTSAGYLSLNANTTGAYNSAFGHDALPVCTTCLDNTSIGQASMLSLVSGISNTAVGVQALEFDVSGANNTAVGLNALQLTTGGANTAAGEEAGKSNTTGNRNTFIGFESGKNTDASDDDCLGMRSCLDLTSGAQNTVVGANGGGGLTTGSNNTIIGANTGGIAAGTNNKIIISDGVGAGQLWLSVRAPTSVNHGTLGTGSSNTVGNVTGVGAFTSVVLTYADSGFPNRSWCLATPNGHSVTAQFIEVTLSATAPTFSCFTTTTGIAANCDDFTYWCTGQ